MIARDEERLTSCPDDDTSCPTCDAFWESGAAADDGAGAQEQHAEVPM